MAITKDRSIPWYIGYLTGTFLHYGRQFWLDIPAEPKIPDPPLEWDTPLSYASFACYFLFVREVMEVRRLAPKLSRIIAGMAWILGGLISINLFLQSAFNYEIADKTHQVVQALFFPVLVGLVAHVLKKTEPFYEKLILVGTVALVIGFLCVVALRRWPGGTGWIPEIVYCFPTSGRSICLYHLKVGIAIDVLCFSWAITLRQQWLLKTERPPIPIPNRQEISTPKDAFVTKVEQYLDQNYSDETLTVERIAQGLNLSAGQLNRKLKGKTGLTTEQVRLRYCLQDARKLLL
jgi:hypothetical protein